MVRLLCLAIGYLFGLFQTSYIYGRMHGIDIREHGSGNAGTTNALRTLGLKAGLITFAGDCLEVHTGRGDCKTSVWTESCGMYPSAGTLRGCRNDSWT